jgi:hypothetical protein
MRGHPFRRGDRLAGHHEHPVVPAGELPLDHHVAAGRRERTLDLHGRAEVQRDVLPLPAVPRLHHHRRTETCQQADRLLRGSRRRRRARPERPPPRAVDGSPACPRDVDADAAGGIRHRGPRQPAPGTPTEPEQAQITEPFHRNATPPCRRDDRARARPGGLPLGEVGQVGEPLRQRTVAPASTAVTRSTAPRAGRPAASSPATRPAGIRR